MFQRGMIRAFMNALIIGVVVIFFLAVVALQSNNDKLLGMAIVPSVAIEDMLQIQSNNFQRFRIVADHSLDVRHRMVVFRYIVPGKSAHEEFGYAITELRAGWSAYPGALFGQAIPPAPISYASIQTQDHTFVYGIIHDLQAHAVEVTFVSGDQQQNTLIQDGFLISVRGQTQIARLNIMDYRGHVIFTSTAPELHTPSR